MQTEPSDSDLYVNPFFISQTYNLQKDIKVIPLKMFPNDDICNADIARLAAMRLFKKYKKEGEKIRGLGKDEVNNLMRATYQAINMPYTPNQEDIFSFMSVFDSNNDGRIDLKDIEQIAVKYLCGIQSPKTLVINSSSSNPEDKLIQQKRVAQQTIYNQRRQIQYKPKQVNIKNQKDAHQINKKKQFYKKDNNFKSNKLEINVSRPINESSRYTTVYSPTYKTQPVEISIKTFYSPKHKQNQNNSNHFNLPTKPRIQMDEIIRIGQKIFNKYASPQWQGILENNAGKVIADTYEIFNKVSYVASGEDIKTWMKLCSNGKTNVVDWQGYRHFLLKTYERQTLYNKC